MFSKKASKKADGSTRTLGNFAKDQLLGRNFLLVVTIVLFAIMYVAGIIAFGGKGFGNMQVFLNLLIDNAGLLITAVGMTMVLIIGGIDISVGSVITISCMGLAGLMEKANMPAIPAILIVLLFGVVFGAFQGWLISYLDIQPFIVTLAGMFLAKGLAALISLEMISIKNATFKAMANAKITMPFGAVVNRQGVTVYPYIFPTVIVAFIVLIAVFVLLRYTKFGRKIYAVGGSEQSALLLGLNVRRTKIQVYMINGFLATLGGVMYCLNMTGAALEFGKGFEMDAIASTVIGGTPLTGGVGNPVGTLFGVLIKAITEKFVQYPGNVSGWWAKIIIAALLAFFIILQKLIASRKKT